MYQETEITPTTAPRRNRRQKWLTAIVLIISIGAGIAVSFLSLRRDMSVVNLSDLIEAGVVWINGWYWMLGALLCLAVILVTGALRLYVLLRAKRVRVTLRDAYRYSILSKYYVLITPFGLGGQPVTTVYMRRKNIPFGVATIIPMIDLFAMRFSMLLIGLATVIFAGHLVVPWVRIMAYIGLFFSCILPVIGISASWFPIFEKLVVGFLKRLTFLKKRDTYIKTTTDAFRKYRGAFQQFQGYKKELLAVFLYALMSQLALLSIPFFILKAYPSTHLIGEFDVALNYQNTVAMVAFASIAVTFIPTVGNAGAIEFSFSTVFSTFMEGRFLFWAMLAWRFLTFYVFLLLGLILTMYLGVNSGAERRRHQIPDLTKKLRIVIFTDNFFPMIDGVVRTVDAYARHLLALGHEPLVIAPTYKTNNERLPYAVLHVPSLRLPRQEYALGIFPFTKAIKDALRYDGPQMFHTHAPFMIAHKALRYARANNIPIISTFHSKYYEDFYENTHSRTLARWGVNRIVHFYRRIDEVWTVSRKTTTTLKHYGYRGDVRIMPNGSDFEVPDNLTLFRRQAEEYLKIGPEDNVLLFVGHLIWQKNLKFIFATLKKLDERGFDYHMVFIGEGGHERMVRKYADSLNLKGKVTFGGVIKDRLLLAGIYAASRLHFFPSVYDNAPLVIREAAAVGLPSLLVRGSHSAEIIVDNVSGFTEREDEGKMADKIIDIMTHPDHLSTVGETARATIPMRWDAIVQEAVERYHMIVANYYEIEE